MSRIPSKCPVCQKIFSRAFNLKVHMDVHQKTRKLVQCSKCERTFTRQTDVDRHFDAKHSKSSNVECNRCLKRFTRKDALIRHQTIKNRCTVRLDNIKRLEERLEHIKRLEDRLGHPLENGVEQRLEKRLEKRLEQLEDHINKLEHHIEKLDHIEQYTGTHYQNSSSFQEYKSTCTEKFELKEKLEFTTFDKGIEKFDTRDYGNEISKPFLLTTCFDNLNDLSLSSILEYLSTGCIN